MDIYADHNATTPLGSGALEEMQRAVACWGNPSSTHQAGQKASELLESCRETVARAAGVSPSEVVFTSGGAEANGMALLGSLFKYPKPFRFLTTEVEHASVGSATSLLSQLGAEIRFIGVSLDGELDVEDFKKQVHEFRPHLASVMSANNETGIVFPISELAKICREAEVCFHTDAVQSFGKMPATDWNDADLISISAHKVYGPKGCGALIVRRGTQLERTRFGGGQETKRRGGTQNMLGIAGFAGACKELSDEKALARLRSLRDRFEQKVLGALESASVLGAKAARLPNTSSLRIKGIPSPIMLSALDLDGMCVSAGSACSSGSVAPSHVLTAHGLSEDAARESLRISWGIHTNESIVDKAADLVISHTNRILERNARKPA